MRTISIIDYGCGNLKSVQKAMSHFGFSAQIAQTPDQLSVSEVLILPGQGAIGQAMIHLKNGHLIEPIKTHIQNGKPFMGICLGLQLLFEYSEEDGGHEGMGLFRGTVKRFTDPSLTIPQMGWNTLNIVQDPNGWLSGIGSTPYAYFANSYYVDTPDSSLVCTRTDYGHSFVSSIQKGNLIALQFHPEKSGSVGMTILNNFLKTFM